MKTRQGFTLIELLVVIVYTVLVGVMAAAIGNSHNTVRVERELVRRGVAHYQVNDNGKVKCVWNKATSVTVVTNDLVRW